MKSARTEAAGSTNATASETVDPLEKGKLVFMKLKLLLLVVLLFVTSAA